MKKNVLNNRGFVLAETLVVALCVSLIFSLIFSNFYPQMGEYEVRENYDDVDSKYGTYWIKKIIQSNAYKINSIDANKINNDGFVQFDCEKLENGDNSKIILQNACYEMLEKLEISCDDSDTEDKIEMCDHSNKPHIYITKFELNGLRQKLDGAALPETLKDYIRYLPDYNRINATGKNDVNRHNAKYRIIVEYYRHRFDTPRAKDESGNDIYAYQVDNDYDFKTYSTIEVIK